MYKILIVSDDPLLQGVVGMALTDVQIEVRYTPDVQTMAPLCEKIKFDLIIVLRVKPFMSGYNLVREVRPSGLRRPLIYVVSWQQSEQTVLSLLEGGVDQYMTFPVSLGRLRVKVMNELSRVQ